jgi:hypothetical protein
MKYVIFQNLVTGTAAAMLAFVPLVGRGQGTVYLSNLGQPAAGSLAVGSDSLRAELFETGTNAAGYLLNSVQLALSTASGNPTAFTISVHTNASAFYGRPGGSIGELTGESNPTSAGVYTYAAASSITLLPHGLYFIVISAGTPLADGAYDWSTAGTATYASPDGWMAGPLYNSSGGSSWTQDLSSFPLFAINATAIPEPASLVLISLVGGVLFATRRRKDLRLRRRWGISNSTAGAKVTRRSEIGRKSSPPPYGRVAQITG